MPQKKYDMKAKEKFSIISLNIDQTISKIENATGNNFCAGARGRETLYLVLSVFVNMLICTKIICYEYDVKENINWNKINFDTKLFI